LTGWDVFLTGWDVFLTGWDVFLTGVARLQARPGRPAGLDRQEQREVLGNRIAEFGDATVVGVGQLPVRPTDAGRS